MNIGSKLQQNIISLRKFIIAVKYNDELKFMQSQSSPLFPYMKQVVRNSIPKKSQDVFDKLSGKKSTSFLESKIISWTYKISSEVRDIFDFYIHNPLMKTKCSINKIFKGKPQYYRFIGPEELRVLKRDGKIPNSSLYITNDPYYNFNRYRVTFKPSVNWDKECRLENRRNSSFLLSNGYSINDILCIERTEPRYGNAYQRYMLFHTPKIKKFFNIENLKHIFG